MIILLILDKINDCLIESTIIFYYYFTMGKFFSKISPKSDPTRHFDIANKKVSRKVLYRRLQSPQKYYEKSGPGIVDFFAYNWPFLLTVAVAYFLMK